MTTAMPRGATAYSIGAIALAFAQWLYGVPRTVAWIGGMAFVWFGIRASGATRSPSRRFNIVAVVGVGVWLTSVVVHAVVA